MDYIPLNFAILGHPINWVTVWLMLLIAAFAIQSVFDLFKTSNKPATTESE